MAVTLKKRGREVAVFQIAPMIDVVFLLLIYFMVTSTLQKQEADIAFQLPGVAALDEPLELPDEQIIEIDATGQVTVNDYRYDAPGARRLVQLAAMLTRFKQSSDANRVEAVVTIAPADGVAHQIVVRVMDACARAGIENVNFALGDD
ncbi:biopolymer transporter ExbD [Opitutales bacterium ASA1]|uniref:ExbD/TolR family protein n=1 Tax=Congregicoccus parvus TaxID=3081749 RepID=UPI002B30008F|nr:biopolymer transporter ExbD [Opitutales bacterium ASA1]